MDELKKTRLKICFLISFFILLLFSFFVPWEKYLRGNSAPPSFFDITHRDENYYSQLSNACAGLLADRRRLSSRIPEKPETDFEAREIKGNDFSLPKILADMHASLIDVHSRLSTTGLPSVSVQVGFPRNGYLVTWERKKGQPDNYFSIISISDEKMSVVVFSDLNSTLGNRANRWVGVEWKWALSYSCFIGLLLFFIFCLVAWTPRMFFLNLFKFFSIFMGIVLLCFIFYLNVCSYTQL